MNTTSLRKIIFDKILMPDDLKFCNLFHKLSNFFLHEFDVNYVLNIITISVFESFIFIF